MTFAKESFFRSLKKQTSDSSTQRSRLAGLSLCKQNTIQQCVQSSFLCEQTKGEHVSGRFCFYSVNDFTPPPFPRDLTGRWLLMFSVSVPSVQLKFDPYFVNSRVLKLVIILCKCGHYVGRECSDTNSRWGCIKSGHVRSHVNNFGLDYPYKFFSPYFPAKRNIMR